MIYDLPTQDNFVRAWQSGAMSAAAFCRLHDLPYHRFLLWRRRLERSSDGRDAVAFVELVPSADSAARSASAPSPTGVALHSAHSSAPAVQGAPSALLAELVLPGGVLLRFFQSCPNATNAAPSTC